MSEQEQVTVSLTQQQDYQFLVDFGAARGTLLTDEGSPLGADAGPNPSRLLGAAIANCLAASLLFALRKFHNQPDPLRAEATLTMTRNAQGRLRIGGVDVQLSMGRATADLTQLDRILAQFEDFCVVTQSVRQGLPVTVSVRDADGRLVHGGKAG